jgi:hypothetical protein
MGMAYKDPEQQRVYARAWIKRNAEKAREAMRHWRIRNPELRRERDREYKRSANERCGAEINAVKAAWLAAHPEVRRAKDQGYRARKRAAHGSFTGAEWLALVEQYAGGCGYGGCPGSPSGRSSKAAVPRRRQHNREHHSCVRQVQSAEG